MNAWDDKNYFNKYQEALYILTDWFHSYTDTNGIRVHERHINCNYEKAKETLQELIDEYISFKEGYELLFKEKWKIEEALEEACSALETVDKQLCDEYGGGTRTKENWKEWCIKNVKAKMEES